MEQFGKWFNKESSEVEDYWMPRSKWAELTWRAAFKLMSEWLEIEESYEVFQARIKNELGDT
jgi:hypothetical protein